MQHDREAIEEMRGQEKLKMELKMAYQRGDTQKVEQIKRRLEADNPDEVAAKKRVIAPWS